MRTITHNQLGETGVKFAVLGHSAIGIYILEILRRFCITILSGNYSLNVIFCSRFNSVLLGVEVMEFPPGTKSFINDLILTGVIEIVKCFSLTNYNMIRRN